MKETLISAIAGILGGGAFASIAGKLLSRRREAALARIKEGEADSVFVQTTRDVVAMLQEQLVRVDERLSKTEAAHHECEQRYKRLVMEVGEQQAEIARVKRKVDGHGQAGHR